MASPTKAERLNRIHTESMREFETVQAAVRDIRLECLTDRRFYSLAGAQWEGALGEQFENRLKFEFNKVHAAILRIVSEYRNNRISVDFFSKEGDEHDELAETCQDLFRADEQDSNAEEAYDNAFEEGASGGFGAFRLRACYEDEEDDENEKQRIRIEPIFDADSSVFFDLDAKRQDKADAKKCWVLTSMTPEAYEDQWGEQPITVNKTVSGEQFEWFSADVVYVAEYYKVEERSEAIYTYASLLGEEEKYSQADFDADPELMTTLEATGWREVSVRKVKRKRVHKYMMSGSHILEDCGYIAGKRIPIVPYYGKRWFIDNIERCMGHVRLSKDAQRLKNMQLSKIGEMAATSPVSKPIFTPEQMTGPIGQMWQDDPVENYPYMLAGAVRNPDGSIAQTGPIGYTKAPEIPPAVAALLQMTEMDMQEILGNQQQADKIVSNVSAKAIELVGQRVDMQTFIYISNFAKAIRAAGEIWLSMAREIYVEKGRKMKGVGKDGAKSTVELMRPVVGEDGAVEYENDLTEATFDVGVDVGPTSDSKRQATVRALTGMMQVTTDPETMSVLSAAAMMNMEGEGIKDMRQFFRNRLLKMGAVKPTEEEQQELAAEAQNMPPDPQQEYLKAAAEQATAEGAKARATTVKTIAEAEKIRTQTAEILANMDMAEREEMMKMADAIANSQNPAPAQPV